MFYLFDIGMSNGFEYPCGMSVHNDWDDAVREFERRVASLRTDYPEEEVQSIVTDKGDGFKVYWQDMDNMSGNGHAVKLYSDERMAALIEERVEDSENTVEFKHMGVDASYTMDVKAVLFDTDEAVNFWGVERVPRQIVRRPYNPEQPNGGEWLCDVTFEGKDGVPYTESLEELPVNALYAVYKLVCFGR